MTKFDNTQEHPVPEGYILGLGRDFPHPRTAHLYQGKFSNPGNPMCKRGWNRDDGRSYSIWRGCIGTSQAVCKICWRRALAAKNGIEAAKGENDGEETLVECND